MNVGSSQFGSRAALHMTLIESAELAMSISEPIQGRADQAPDLS